MCQPTADPPSNVTPFPRSAIQPERRLSRVFASERLVGFYEAQAFENGKWGARSVHVSREAAIEASKKLCQRLILERMAAEHE